MRLSLLGPKFWQDCSYRFTVVVDLHPPRLPWGQLRIRATPDDIEYQRIPRACPHRSEFRLARKLRGVLWLEHEENGEQREGTGVVVRRQSDGVAGLRIDPGDYRLRRVPQGSFLFAGAFWAIDPRRGFFCSPASD